MGVTPAGQRAEKWNRRYDADHIKTIIDNEKPTFYAHAQSKFQMLVDMEAAVKQVLNTAGVSVATTANYLAYARQLWKASQTYSGETLAVHAASLVATWASRGMSQAVLEAIRYQVFNVSAPVGPVS